MEFSNQLFFEIPYTQCAKMTRQEQCGGHERRLKSREKYRF